jgi:hypothetical protein
MNVNKIFKNYGTSDPFRHSVRKFRVIRLTGLHLGLRQPRPDNVSTFPKKIITVWPVSGSGLPVKTY